jgi:predicted glycosyltransferase
MGSVLIHVQHLFGIGHMTRAATLARSMVGAGMDVIVVVGGYPVPGLDFGGARLEQLPPAKAADSTFSTLLDEDGKPIDDAWRARRKDRLLSLVRREKPSAVVLELFPFGRRQLRFELLPMLEETRDTLIVSSVRDILVKKRRPERYLEMAALAETWFQMILVHSDPRVVRFDDTFPLADRLQDRLFYTGFIVDRDRPATEDGHGEVIVSAGGGAGGRTLLRVAMEARALSSLSSRPWRLLVGHALGEADFKDLLGRAGGGIIVERARPDFPGLLGNCTVSISQAGYNTVMDLLNARARPVLVPFAEEEESEQSLRAESLRRRGLARVVDSENLTAESLAAAVDSALDLDPPPQGSVDMDGANVAARLIGERLEGKRTR